MDTINADYAAMYPRERDRAYWLQHKTDPPHEKSFYTFVKAAWPNIEAVPFIDNWHIGAICEHLQAITEGQIKRLLINVPPGCSKSLLTSVFWPCWEWTFSPEIRWFFASYDQRLSTRDSVKCRSLIGSRWYQERWQVKFTGDQNQKTYYETEQGGYRLATSVEGHTTGEHPDRVGIDDPQDIQGAESEAELQSLFDWWDLTMPTRGVSRDCRYVVIMQRLKETDFTAHILDQGGWEHICLPMRYERGVMKPTALEWTDPRQEEGELLTPKQFDEEKVTGMEKRLGVYGTSGQLQQRPVPRSGGMFKLEWFKIVDAAPWQAARVRFWDRAASEGKGDFSAGVKIAKTDDGRYYIENVVKGQWSPQNRDKIILQTAELDALQDPSTEIVGEEEPGSSGKDVSVAFIRMLARFPVYAERVTGEKYSRGRPLASQAEAGNVFIVRGEWNKEFLQEMCAVPKGKHDDQFDGASGAFNRLALKSSDWSFGAAPASESIMANAPQIFTSQRDIDGDEMEKSEEGWGFGSYDSIT